jgi:hypothetical protein
MAVLEIHDVIGLIGATKRPFYIFSVRPKTHPWQSPRPTPRQKKLTDKIPGSEVPEELNVKQDSSRPLEYRISGGGLSRVEATGQSPFDPLTHPSPLSIMSQAPPRASLTQSSLQSAHQSDVLKQILASLAQIEEGTSSFFARMYEEPFIIFFPRLPLIERHLTLLLPIVLEITHLKSPMLLLRQLVRILSSFKPHQLFTLKYYCSNLAFSTISQAITIS